MPNLYGDLTMISTALIGNPTLSTVDTATFERDLESASRLADRFCNRQFYASSETRVFDGTGKDPNNTDYLNWATRSLFTASLSYLRLPDCLSASSVALDQDSDGVFETALTPTTDYYLLNEGGPNQDTAPFDKLQLNIFTGKVTVFSARPRLVQIVGSWGYTNATVAESVTATLADAVTSTMTTSGAGSLARGQTLLLGSEQLYLTGGGATSWTVLRGVNGTVAAAHTAVLVQRYSYEPDVRRAVLDTVRTWYYAGQHDPNVLETQVENLRQRYAPAASTPALLGLSLTAKALLRPLWRVTV